MIHRIKAQSAMEYLMTYGWAILIIAVILGALFQLGVFGGTSVTGTSCVASPGYLCTYLTYSHSDGTIKVSVGQNTGIAWTGWAVMFAPSGAAVSANTIPKILFVGQSGALASGQQASVTLSSGAGATPVGTVTFGDIWVCYTTTAGSTGVTAATGGCDPATTGTVQYTQIATFTAKAV